MSWLQFGVSRWCRRHFGEILGESADRGAPIDPWHGRALMDGLPFGSPAPTTMCDDRPAHFTASGQSSARRIRCDCPRFRQRLGLKPALVLYYAIKSLSVAGHMIVFLYVAASRLPPLHHGAPHIVV